MHTSDKRSSRLRRTHIIKLCRTKHDLCLPNVHIKTIDVYERAEWLWEMVAPRRRSQARTPGINNNNSLAKLLPKHVYRHVFCRRHSSRTHTTVTRRDFATEKRTFVESGYRILYRRNHRVIHREASKTHVFRRIISVLLLYTGSSDRIGGGGKSQTDNNPSIHPHIRQYKNGAREFHNPFRANRLRRFSRLFEAEISI